MTAMNVFVIGHSYIRRLKEYCVQKGTENLGLDPKQYHVTFRGKGGLKLSKCPETSWSRNIVHPEFLCFDTVPDVVFLQIGENDISTSTNSRNLAMDIISVAQYLRDGVGVKLIIIGQLIRRMQFASCRDFNATVVEINLHVQQMNDPLCGIHYWGHRGFWNGENFPFWNDLQYLGPDGVHLLCAPTEDQPMRKYLRSVRNAVILLSKLLRPV
ncbi:uncharacterized protein LOC133181159 [Saccostrea echinata]|uniref:uncharacterized protein LOC133181159 n=1 Tax=Saccostrea echinata TaxID=191078 RepID=UPI002A82E52D|nr:uncharacterized protein LOC133181159 [Saccostrea echinata]